MKYIKLYEERNFWNVKSLKKFIVITDDRFDHYNKRYKYLMKLESFTESKTYIKTFEIAKQKPGFYYWRLDNKSITHISLSLLKIGLTEDDQCYNDIMNKEAEYVVKHNRAFYVGRGINDLEPWKAPPTLKSEDDFFYFYSYNLDEFKGEFKYLGHLYITKQDIQTQKYNL